MSLHLPAASTPPGPDDIGLRVFWPSRPPALRLVCGSCSSGRSFACGFLPTTPRGDAVAVRLGVPVTEVPRGLAPPRHFPIRFRYRLTAPATALRAMPGAPKKRARCDAPPSISYPSAEGRAPSAATSPPSPSAPARAASFVPAASPVPVGDVLAGVRAVDHASCSRR